jgi:hypothetical protein
VVLIVLGDIFHNHYYADNGSDYYIPNALLPGPENDSETVTVWFNFAYSYWNGKYLMYRVYDFYVYSDATYYYLYYWVGSGSVLNLKSPNPIKDDYWEHFAFTKTLAPKYNNILMSNYEYSAVSTITAMGAFSASDLYLGSSSSNTNIPHNLYMKELAVYTQYKSMNELRSLKFRSHKKYEDNLYVYFKINERYNDQDYKYDFLTEDTSSTFTDNYSTYGDWRWVAPANKRNYKESLTVDEGVLLLESSVSDFLQLDAQTMAILGDFTFQTIFKLSGDRSDKVKLFSNTDVFDVGIETDGAIYIILTDSDAATLLDVETSFQIVEDEWMELSVVRDYQVVKVYIDTELRETFSCVSFYHLNSFKLKLGAKYSECSDKYNFRRANKGRKTKITRIQTLEESSESNGDSTSLLCV